MQLKSKINIKTAANHKKLIKSYQFIYLRMNIEF